MLVIDQRGELRFQAAQITDPYTTSPVYLHLVSKGIRFKNGGKFKKQK